MLFAGIGLAFVFVNLLVGRFLRPDNPHKEKQEIYECGEPAIGSSFVQFDLRFYVVALIFIIFDVEVAFLFPWATVFGKITNLRNDGVALVQVEDNIQHLTPAATGLYRELGDTVDAAAPVPAESVLQEGQFASDGTMEIAGLDQIVQYVVIEICVFFVVLLVGFAYVWRMGALDWVRATSPHPQSSPVDRPTPDKGTRQASVLSA